MSSTFSTAKIRPTKESTRTGATSTASELVAPTIAWTALAAFCAWAASFGHCVSACFARYNKTTTKLNAFRVHTLGDEKGSKQQPLR